MSWQGIDVSDHQSGIDWGAVAASGVVFAIIRQADGDYNDPNFLANIDGAKAAGLHVGCYYYTHATSDAESRQDARDLINALQGRAVDMPLYIDIEDAAGVAMYANEIAGAWYDECTKAGFKGGLYCSASYYSSYINTGFWADKPVWIAAYGFDSCPTDDAGIWQYSETGACGGIGTNVDLDEAFVAEWGDLENFPTVVNDLPKPKPTPNTNPTAPDIDGAKNGFIKYQAHVQNAGWHPVQTDGAVAGTTGQNLRMEALAIESGIPNVTVKTSGHVQDIGWQDWRTGHDAAGTTGGELRLEAIRAKLEGADAEKYDLYYSAHVQYLGWLDWAKNGEIAGTTGCGLKLEAVRIMVLEKGKKPPDNTDGRAFANLSCPSLTMRGHVQDRGWMNPKAGESGQPVTIGTTGASLRLEAFTIAASGGLTIAGKAHMQNMGWCKSQAGADGIGTTGQKLRLEAIELGLNGALANVFKLWYRVHVQNIGWMDWTTDAQAAGTTGGSLRIEALEAVVLPIGHDAPGNTGQPFKAIVQPAPGPQAASGGTRDGVVAKALEQVGYTAGDGNYTEFGQWYQDNVDSGADFAHGQWCAMMVSWCAAVAGVSRDIIKPFAYVPYMVAWFRQQGEIHDAAGGYEPEPGDIVFFRWDGAETDDCDHVGLVVDYSNGIVTTVEGNTGSSEPTVCTENQYSYTADFIIWYARPNY